MAPSEAGVSHLNSRTAASRSTAPASTSAATGPAPGPAADGSGRPGSGPAHTLTHGSSPDWPRESGGHFATVRYRGFVLIPQADLTWLIRPERSPMRTLPFRAPASSLTDVKALVDWRLAQHEGR